jgi:hypothetical protein
MRRLTRWLWITVAIIFLVEAWLWDRLEPIVARIVDRLPLRRLKVNVARWVGRLSPALSLLVFVVPFGLLLPFKFAAIWLLARGYWIGATGTFVFAKLVGLGSTAFIFDVTRKKLLQLAWFRWLYDHVMAWRVWAHELVDPVVKDIKAHIAMFRPQRAGRAMRLLLRIRRRVQTPPPPPVSAAKLERSGAASP